MDEIIKEKEKKSKKIEDDYKNWEQQNKLQFDLLNLNHQANLQQINYQHQKKMNQMDQNFQNQMYILNQNYLNDINNVI